MQPNFEKLSDGTPSVGASQFGNSQIDINDQSSWLLFYRLQDVFRNANPENPEQTFAAMQSALGHMNVVDEDSRPNSPWRNRPASLDDPKYKF